ncbi:hypothetical protein Drorol1_Dr00008112 [Drosera rotundifolia]
MGVETGLRLEGIVVVDAVGFDRDWAEDQGRCRACLGSTAICLLKIVVRRISRFDRGNRPNPIKKGRNDVAEAVGWGGALVMGLLVGRGRERKEEEREVVGIWATTHNDETGEDSDVRVTLS